MRRFCILLLAGAGSLFACTSAVISGNITKDGRPLLWKHRDTGSLENRLVYIETEKYDFMGIVNADDSSCANVWMGVNETGFAVMNTASYNLNTHVSCNVDDDQEGLFMRYALERCSSVDDFEDLLNSESGQWGISANFGVIDSCGGAAYFEAGYYNYVKFNANDPAVAPGGYLIRTNFSFSGNKEDGQGYLRYKEASRLFADKKNITPDFLIQQVSRHTGHAAETCSISSMKRPRSLYDTTLTAFNDYICRYWSASVLVIRGINNSEAPENIEIYPVVGFPYTTPVAPLLYGFKKSIPSVIHGNKDKIPFTAKESLKLKDRCFPLTHDDHENYIDVSKLKTRFRKGSLDKINRCEKNILTSFRELGNHPSADAIFQYNKGLNEYIRLFYKNF